jgi:hypothetical protein
MKKNLSIDELNNLDQDKIHWYLLSLNLNPEAIELLR